MKYIIYILLLVISTAQAQVVSRVGAGLNKNSKTGIGFRSTLPPNSNVTVDMWQTFEFTNPTTANLDANDNTSTGTWITNDASLMITTSTTGERALVGTINGSTDTGHTKGLAKTYSATDIGNVQYDIGSGNTKTTVSVGMWYRYTGNPGADKTIFTLNGSSLDLIRVKIQSADDTITFHGGGNNNVVALVQNTFYWITAQFTQNATCYCRVYNTSGVQVGTEITVTGANQAFRYFTLGYSFSEAADGTITSYWDDAILDATDATYPLGP